MAANYIGCQLLILLRCRKGRVWFMKLAGYRWIDLPKFSITHRYLAIVTELTVFVTNTTK